MLELVDARGGYAGTTVLHGMALRIQDGEAVALLGRNGSGKTSTMKYLMGLLNRSSGAVLVDGDELPHRPEARSHTGIGYVPQGRFVFPRLTVKENIVAAAAEHKKKTGHAIDELFTLFPALAAKANALAGQLSGGQQQMLAVGRALATDPKVLLLDEPTEGVQPSIVDDMIGVLREVSRQRGMAMLVAEQDIDFALSLAQRAYVIDRGQVSREMHGAEIVADRDALHQLLGIYPSAFSNRICRAHSGCT